MIRLMLLMLLCLVRLDAANKVIQAPCKAVKQFVIEDAADHVPPRVPTVKGNTITVTEAVREMSETMRKIGNFPPGTKTGNTKVFTFTPLGEWCGVDIQLTSPIKRIADNHVAAEDAMMYLILDKFPKKK